MNLPQNAPPARPATFKKHLLLRGISIQLLELGHRLGPSAKLAPALQSLSVGVDFMFKSTPQNKFHFKHASSSLTSLTAFLSLVLVLNSCGGSSNNATPLLPPDNTGGITPPSVGGPGPGPGGPTTPNPTPTITPAPTGGDTSTLTYSFNLGGTGTSASISTFTSPNITTDTRLRIKVIGGPAGNVTINGGPYKGKYSNYTASYSCVTYKITVAGQSMITPMIKVGENGTGLCASSPSEQVLDFSGRLTPGHGPVKVKVSEPKYDYYCKLYLSGWIFGSFNNFCPLYSVYKNHKVTGSLEIEVNGSSL